MWKSRNPIDYPKYISSPLRFGENRAGDKGILYIMIVLLNSNKYIVKDEVHEEGLQTAPKVVEHILHSLA